MSLPRQEYATKLGDKLNLLANIIKTRSRAGLTDGNKILESIIRRTFNALFGWELINLNSEKPNFPAADLGDRTRRLAIQVTNEASPEKIGLTAAKAQEHGLEGEFDKLIVFFLLAQKPGFPRQFKQPERGPSIVTWDNAEVVKQATEVDDILAIRRAIDILDEEMQPLNSVASSQIARDGSRLSEQNLFDHVEYGLSKEQEFLLPSFFLVVFPELIHKAKIILKRGIKLSEQIEASWKRLNQKGTPPIDYYFDRDGYVYTFDSFDSQLWRFLIEDKAIKPQPSFKTSNWSKSNLLAERNLFTKLLQRNLEHLCLNVGTEFKLAWSKELRCYLFQAKTNIEIGRLKVTALSKSGTREVFKSIPNTLPGREGEIQHWKHQAFRHRFVNFGGEWLLNIEPFWAFTCDGKTSPSSMHSSSSRNFQKLERNRSVLGHILFWAALLCKEPDMFAPSSAIRLHRPARLQVSPSICDDDWKDIEPDDEKKILTDDSKEELWLL